MSSLDEILKKIINERKNANVIKRWMYRHSLFGYNLTKYWPNVFLLFVEGYRSARMNTKRFWQRGRRGWADSDTWSFDHYLLTVIPDAIALIRETKHGYPTSMVENEIHPEATLDELDAFMDQHQDMLIEKWDNILSEIENGLRDYARLMNYKIPDDQEDAVTQRYENAMILLTKYMGSLWT